jgi:hypothetical protein
MPTAKIKINGVMYTVGGISAGERQSILDDASQYANQLINGMDEEIADLQQAIQDTDTYIEGAFKDGLISEAEAKAIQTHLKTLATRKSELDREYSDIFGNVFINQVSKDALTSAKDLYETSYTALVNEINTAIVDGKTNPAETSIVDQKFLDYNQSLSLLVSALTSAADQIGKSKADDAYLDSVDYTDGELAPIRTDLVEAWSEIEQTPTKIALAVSKTEIETQLAVIHDEAVSQSNTYATPIKTATNNAISTLRTKLADLETYVTNSYSDGNITALESSTTTTYINALETAKTSFNSDFNAVATNTYLAEILQGDLQFSKSVVDSAHTDLVSAINSVMVDTSATAEEVNDVATKFQKYEDAITAYDTDAQKCLTSITNNKAIELEEGMVANSDTVLIPISSRVNTMESQIVQQADSILLKVSKKSHDADLLDRLNQAKQYADDLKSITDQSVADLRKDLGDTEEYIESSFRDGIIYEAEYRKIQAFLNTLNESKTQFDSRYAEIYGNSALVGTPKTDLSTAKSNYDTKYDELVTTINNAIEDQLADITESQAVDTAFTAYNNSITLLSTTLEKAIDSIAQAKANTAQTNAKEYTEDLVEGIEIGGRNILRDSETIAVNSNNSNVYPISVANMIEEGLNFKRVTLATGFTTPTISLYENIPGSKLVHKKLKGKNITLSVRVRSDATGGQSVAISPYFLRPDGTTKIAESTLPSVVLDGSWQTLSYTITNFPEDLTNSDTQTVLRYVIRTSGDMTGKYLDIRGYQVEYGTKPTDWTPAPEDAVAGGRNLMRYTNNFVDTTGWNMSGGTDISATWGIVEDSIYGNVMNVNMTVNAGTGSNWLVLTGNELTMPSGVFTPGESYTVSFLVKSTIPLVLSFRDSNGLNVVASGTYSILNATSWKRVWWTFKAVSSGVNPVFYLQKGDNTSVGEFSVTQVKLEKGSVPSDWTPAPEDVDALMDKKIGINYAKLTSEYSSAIELATDEINLSVSKSLSTTEGNLIKYIDTEVSATAGQFEIKFTEIDSTTASHETQLAEVNSYFKFSPTGLNIGKSDSPLQINISNSQMDFIDNGAVVAYVNGQKMYIDSLEVLTNLVVGNHKIEKYNTNITLIKWAGG